MTQLCLSARKLLSEQRKKSSEVTCSLVVQIIHEKYDSQDLSVLSISQELGLSPNYLSGLIKKNTGNTLVEMITDKRIESAKQLLCGTSLKIGEIAGKCGYKDQYYFSHCFKKKTGLSPNSFRRQHEKQGK